MIQLTMVSTSTTQYKPIVFPLLPVFIVYFSTVVPRPTRPVAHYRYSRILQRIAAKATLIMHHTTSDNASNTNLGAKISHTIK